MNKVLTFLCFGILILSATSHAMDPLRPGSGQAGQAGQASSSSGQVIPQAKRHGAQLRGAAEDGNLELVRALINQGAPIDAQDYAGWTSLICAANNGHEKICTVLIENKASINATCKYGTTPLIYAAHNGHENTCKLLIDALLVPIKQEQATAIAFLGMKKYRNTPYFHQIDREVIRLIIRPPYEISKQKLFAQINAIANQDLKQRLLAYAKQQLRVQKMETSHE